MHVRDFPDATLLPSHPHVTHSATGLTSPQGFGMPMIVGSMVQDSGSRSIPKIALTNGHFASAVTEMGQGISNTFWLILRIINQLAENISTQRKATSDILHYSPSSWYMPGGVIFPTLLGQETTNSSCSSRIQRDHWLTVKTECASWKPRQLIY